MAVKEIEHRMDFIGLDLETAMVGYLSVVLPVPLK